MGAWGENSFSNDTTYDFLQLNIMYRIAGGVDELDITYDILKEILDDIDKCDDNYTKMASIIFLVYKGCSIDTSYIDMALSYADYELNNIKSKDWSNPSGRLVKLGEEIENLKKAKLNGRIDPLHIPSIGDSMMKKMMNKNID